MAGDPHNEQLEAPAYLGREFSVEGRADDRGHRGGLGAIIVLMLLLSVPLFSGASAGTVIFCSVAMAVCLAGAGLLVRSDIRSNRVPYVRPPRDPRRGQPGS